MKARPVDGEAPSDLEARLRAALLEAIGTRREASILLAVLAAPHQGHRSDP